MKHTNIFSKHALRLIALILCLATVLPLSACGENRMQQREIYSMDTIMTLTAYGKNAEAGLNAAESVILAMDAMLDPELSTSTVYAINNANGSSVVVSAQIAKMINTARTVYQQSGGALDLSLYPLIKRWGFIDQKYYKPTEAEILEDLSRLCFDEIQLTSFPASGSYQLTLPAYGQISFGAAAKGCAAENAVDAMRQAGVESGILSLGGNVQTLGVKPDGSLWRVAIQDPEDPSGYVGVVSVGETAVVTSGPYQRFFTLKDTVYHHIINPATGHPSGSALRSVTILCEDGTMADCLSTAMFVLGETKAINYWRQYGGFEMILITTDDRIVCTMGLLEEFTLSPEAGKYTVRYTE
ncbi:MAG: FAD:protein FMN transferase [Oscillospiraceae bacterium]|nr:FAD:protein FMN transferase [Oscillospiraceae bacterium]